MTRAKMAEVATVAGGECDRLLDRNLFFGMMTRCGRRGMETLSSERVDESVPKVTLY